jgi:methionyl-tRNA formyltransferase
MIDKKIVLLGGEGLSTNVVFNSVNDNFNVTLAIIEKPESRSLFLKRRIKRLGLLTVAGQVLFQLVIVKMLNAFSKKRRKEIITTNALNISKIPDNKLKRVTSVNSQEVLELLKTINPDLIIVNGTRIISKKIICSVNCKLINTHAGITPKYRGVHGTYWALINDDVENSGVTVHFIDEGIDTGNVIYQTRVTPSNKDNFTTYPLLQLSEGIKILNKAISDYFEDTLTIQKTGNESFLWYHPTVWQYLYYKIRKKIK